MRQGWRAQSALFSLGLVLVASGWSRFVQAEDVSLSADRQGIRTAPLFLLTRADIQKELGLTPEQSRDAQSLASELHQKALALRGKAGVEIAASRRAIDDRQTRWLNEKLSRTQLDRLHQIDLRWEGPSAWVSRPIIADYLKLAPEQRQVVSKEVSEHVKERLTNPKPQATEQAFVQRMLTHLTDEQRALWGNLLGQPFEFLADADRPAKDSQTVKAGGEQPR